MPTTSLNTFPSLNRGYADVFRPGRMTIGLVVPIEAYPASPVPTMTRHLERVHLAEALGFSAVWLRDVPFNVPSFGDAGQVLDPFVYLGALAVTTDRIALGVASLILPLRHPAHVAKAAASVDHLSNGRLLLGVASGDRPDEYPAMGARHADRSARFRESFDYIRRMASSFPAFENGFGNPDGGVDLLPKPVADRLPLLVTGGSQQSPAWGVAHADGWITYPRPASDQTRAVAAWRERTTEAKPVMQPLYLDLADDPDTEPTPIHLGLRVGARHLVDYLRAVRNSGVNHVALNLRFNRAAIEPTLHGIAEAVLPEFHEGDTR